MLFLDRLSVMSCGYYYPLSEKNANETNAFSDCFYIPVSNSKLEKYVWLCLSMSICVCVCNLEDRSKQAQVFEMLPGSFLLLCL